MKKVEVTLRPARLDAVKEKLVALGVHGMTYYDAHGFGRQGGHKEVYRGTTYTVDFLPKIRIEVVVHDEALEKVVAAIMEGARTGNVGDGKIFVTDVSDAWRIRTGEHGNAAL